MRRVVITGHGVVSPCGVDSAESWKNIVAGKSGIATIARWDASEFASRIAGECVEFDPERFIEKKRLREMARFIHLAMGAADEVWKTSGFADASDELKARTGTYIGVGFCGLEVVEEQHEKLRTKGPRRMSPYFIPSAISNLAPGQVSMKYGLKGPSFTTTSACSSGAHSIGEAFKWIQRGGIDAAIAGGTEASVTPLGVGGFAAMRALSKRNDAPELASRPFDAGRDGFVIAEGSALVMLEELESAKARGANILAEVVGYGATADAYHMTQPAPEHEGAQRAMMMALEDAQMNASEIDYVNAHGTSTAVGDKLELEAIRSVFGDHATAGASGLFVSSTKSMTGHLLGAAGGLEAVLSLLAMRDGVAPPTINLDDPDPAGEGMELVANQAKERAMNAVLSNSFGFGGTNATLIFRRFSS